MRCSVCDGNLPTAEGEEVVIENYFQMAASMTGTVRCTCPPKELVGEMPKEDEEEGEDWSCQEWFESEKDRFDSLFGPDEEEDSEEDPYGF